MQFKLECAVSVLKSHTYDKWASCCNFGPCNFNFPIGLLTCSMWSGMRGTFESQSYLDFGLWPTADTALKINMDNILANFTI